MNSYSMERMPLCEWNAWTDAWLGNHEEEEEGGGGGGGVLKMVT